MAFRSSAQSPSCSTSRPPSHRGHPHHSPRRPASDGSSFRSIRRRCPGWTSWSYRRRRPPVARTVSRLVHHGNRKLRYRGTIANNIWLHTRAAALNLRRLINLGPTRTDGAWTINPATA
ncbi:transposase [Streptomyces sp. AK08-01B]|uniref:transposase n=1 Tax=unclassified Streptomyces TaxID=2593676 RepID=UPI0039F5A15C